MATTWQTVRVFISSTFRDMHAERDHLVKVVFPRLRQWCQQRRLHLVDIDLRWGVTKEDADNGKALEICLQEIDGSGVDPKRKDARAKKYRKTAGKFVKEKKLKGFSQALKKLGC